MNKTLARAWPSALLAVLGLFYLWIGFAAHGWDGLLGLSGGLVILVATVAAQRSATTAMALLAIGALPLAVATWWSVVTPALAILVLLTGVLAIRAVGGRQDGAARWVTSA